MPLKWKLSKDSKKPKKWTFKGKIAKPKKYKIKKWQTLAKSTKKRKA